ncbi:tautomerase family protein [Pseudomonas sp. TH05]|uniref:tautomerase family protein n=1 Tax=unclassified Pseudomonas TaxID=196821 RepID=UPI00191425C6|nr:MULTISPECIES: tautomerase family protein [unclassified Pseudomonas]MBK5540831.1 tautomerase family protein [Pseudomonas sp. TH07]MBK5556135.1 tautomerase family protein [Pseudomonas sp. TH05]
MPFARISLHRGKSRDYLQRLSEGVHQALVEAFEVPPDDCFQVIHQHEAGELIFNAHYLGGPRTDDYLLIVITAGRPRTGDTKRRFYRALVERLEQSLGLDPEDVMVVISSTEAQDWSFAGGRGNE